MDIIQFINVGEKFKLYHQKNGGLKDRFLDLIKGRKKPRGEFWALKGVSFGVRKGEVVGIIGENGSGKTTILSLIAGILTKPGDVYDLASGIEDLLKDRDLRVELGKRARQQAERKYNWLETAENLLKAYQVALTCH